MGTKGDQTRERIIRAGMQLFSVKGYYHTGIGDILGATGLTKGGLYGHFRSKQDLWYAVYDEAVAVWRACIFARLDARPDPLNRIEQLAANHLFAYLGADVFDGGCFFVNMLVELAGQSAAMSRHIFRGFVGFSKLIQAWLNEAEQKGLLDAGQDHRQIANFILITLNGAATLYVASRERTILDETHAQLKRYLDGLRTPRERQTS